MKLWQTNNKLLWLKNEVERNSYGIIYPPFGGCQVFDSGMIFQVLKHTCKKRTLAAPCTMIELHKIRYPKNHEENVVRKILQISQLQMMTLIRYE